MYSDSGEIAERVGRTRARVVKRARKLHTRRRPPPLQARIHGERRRLRGWDGMSFNPPSDTIVTRAGDSFDGVVDYPIPTIQ